MDASAREDGGIRGQEQGWRRRKRCDRACLLKATTSLGPSQLLSQILIPYSQIRLPIEMYV